MLLLAGIDEAGYGPTLGPLCVGMSVFRIRDWKRGDPAPDLWQLLSKAVCKKPSDSKGRIPVADSKQLKLSNDSKTKHPLIHLERGVLSFLRWLEHSPADDAELFQVLGAELHNTAPWYSGDPISLPLGETAGQLAISSSKLLAAMESAGIELISLRCHIIPEPEFNQIVRRTNSKAEATATAFGHHLRRLATISDAPSIRLVCDQLGGRTSYEGLIARELSNTQVTALTESGDRSRYQVGATDFIIQFMPEAETAHLPVALASMVAKYTRELAMQRFNRYWCARHPELKPTAGYAADARRWLNEMREVLVPTERTALTRIA